MTQRICIIGTASHWQGAPYADPEWTIWGCSPAIAGALPRYDAWFELHDDATIKAQSQEYQTFLLNRGKSVYRQGVDPNNPDAIVFPKDKLVAEFGDRFFTSTIALMLAFAITKKPKQIGLYGVDMGARTEYQHQRPGCWHFMQIAQARGIEIVLPERSLLRAIPGVYGYSTQSQFEKATRERLQQLKELAAKSRADIAALEMQLRWQEGSVETLEDLLSAYLS